MNYTKMSFKVLRKLYDLHLEFVRECPELVTESDHAERHEIAMELDRRNGGANEAR